MKNIRYRFLIYPHVDWVKLNGIKVPLFYDSKLGVFEPFVMYALHIANLKKDGSNQAIVTSMSNVAYHLTALLSFIQKKKISWDWMNDQYLEEFKYWQEKKIINNPTSRGTKAARRTVNQYLITIYKFYSWAEHEVKLCQGLIGWNGPSISSMLPSIRKDPSIKRYCGQNIYPLLFRGVGENSRFNYQYEATAKDIDLLTEYFYTNFDKDVAERNVLILLVANGVGWRQGSINSLKIDQFSDEKVNKSNTIFVKPEIQKYGYENAFEVRGYLANQVNKYINTTRKLLIDKLGVTEETTQKHLFLNVKTGEPLSRKTITDIFSQAFENIGAPKGSGIHSLRAKFYNDEMRVELAVRMREGLPIDPINLGLAMSKKLGQKNLQSQEAYSRIMSEKTWQTLERKQDDRIKELELEIMNLKHNINSSIT